MMKERGQASCTDPAGYNVNGVDVISSVLYIPLYSHYNEKIFCIVSMTQSSGHTEMSCDVLRL